MGVAGPEEGERGSSGWGNSATVSGSGHRFIVNSTVELGWTVGVLVNSCSRISYTQVLG